MAVVREGNKSALLVVDVQVGVVDGAWDVEQVVANIVHAVGQARAAGVPVIWVQHEDEQLFNGSPQWQWVRELQSGADEMTLHKHFNSAFEDTALEAELARLGVAHLVLTGAASNWCIRATAYAALERGYDLTLVGDAHTTATMDLGDGTRIEAADVIRDLNLTMQYVRYSGRSNQTVSAQELVFSA